MAAKISWHRYGTKLRHCHPTYRGTYKRHARVPDEVGAVAAEGRLFEESSDERVLLDDVDVLVTQSASPLHPAARRTSTAADRHRGRGSTGRVGGPTCR